MSKELKPYMGYSIGLGASEGAILIFAFTAKEAKKIGYRASILTDEYIDFAVRLMRNSPYLFKDADQEKLKSGMPHVIDNPTSCRHCESWGSEIGDDGLCQDCRELHDDTDYLKGGEE